MLYLIYLAVCLVVALLGLNRKFGFWGYLFASIALTPGIGLLLVVASDPVRPRRRRPWIAGQDAVAPVRKDAT